MNGCVTDVSDDDDKDNVSLKKKAHCKGHLFKETPLLPTKLAKKKKIFFLITLTLFCWQNPRQTRSPFVADDTLKLVLCLWKAIWNICQEPLK